jgi:3-hydroxyacyl-CoA dehydrogenase
VHKMASINVNRDDGDLRITVIGAGTIGLSFAALHLTYLATPSNLTIMDVRLDLESHVLRSLPAMLPQSLHACVSQVKLISSVPAAVKDSDIIQECGPENLAFKSALWSEVEHHAPPSALLWTSTSGIPASRQNAQMRDPSRLIVVHPFNPPHILPLLEIVPSPQTSQSVIDHTVGFWRRRGREPVLLQKEITGFVAGRLAWVLLQEAIHLVDQDIVTVEQLDKIIETSMGPRWAYAGPFKSFHAGGGPGGLEGLLKNVGPTVQACWDDAGKMYMGDAWEAKVFAQAREAYGLLDLEERDLANRRVLEAVRMVKKRN